MDYFAKKGGWGKGFWFLKRRITVSLIEKFQVLFQRFCMY